MKLFRLVIIPMCLAVLFLFGCYARPTVQPLPEFTTPRFDSTQFESSVDNYLIILDASSSMGDDFRGTKKFVIAREFIDRLNRTLPELGQKSGLRSFGHNKVVSNEKTVLHYGMAPYNTTAFQEKLDQITVPGGTSPMHLALVAANEDLAGLSGKTAVIIISDGQEEYGLDTDRVLDAAQTLKNRMGTDLCYYPVIVGDNEQGADLMEDIAGIGVCGFTYLAENLLTSKSMEDYVKTVFLSKKAVEPELPKDSDKDGVIDDLDRCPDTPKGEMVNEDGCSPVNPMLLSPEGAWAFNDDALFDFDKAVVKPKFYSTLNTIADYLKARPEVLVKIHGHTDNIGPKAYNDALSLKRAEAVKSYLTARGIDEKRMLSKGFGFSKPTASNETDEGRRLNRRVEIYPVEK